MKRPLVLLLALVVVSSSQAATFLVPSDTELVHASRAAVVATATHARTRWAPGGWIETVTTVQVEEVIKGPIRVGEEVEVAELGGVIDGIGYAVAGSPHYTPGERVLLFLETNSRGGWVAKNMALGKFAFRRDGRGRRLLVRDASEIVGWDVDGGAPHVEPARLEEPFLAFVREIAAGGAPQIQYLVTDPAPIQSLSVDTNAAAAASTYLLQSDGDFGNLGIRWSGFPTSVVFLSHGTQPGATSGGLTAIQRGLASWTNDPDSNIVYQYGGTTAIASTGFRGGSNDGTNTIQFNDPANEIPGSFTPTGGSTLAIGGAWFGTQGAASTHMFAGERFYTIVEADLVVQDGITGAGLTGNGFDHVLTHELGHTLGLRHSDQPPAGGTSTSQAIMNSSVAFNSDPFGSNLQSWDREAIAAVYGSGQTTPPCTPPTIVTQPQSVALGSSSVTLNVGATGSGVLQYQWYIGARSNTSQPIPGATSNQINIQPNVTTSYWVRVSNGCDPAADSTAAVVTVNGCPAVSLDALTSTTQAIIQGKSASIQVSASGGTISFQWFLGSSGSTGSPISGATSATLTISPAVTTSYWVQASNSCGAKSNSTTFTITVQPCLAAAIQVQPAGGDVAGGASATLFVGATGTAPLSYQWYSGTAPNTSSPVAGATSQMLVINQLFASANYWVRVTNDCGTVNSATASLRIVASCQPPSISQQPQSQNVSVGATAVLNVTVSGTSLTYQWYQGQVFDFTHPIGGSAPLLVTPPITESTQFWVRVSSPCGSVNSAVATVAPVNTRHRPSGH